jgi:FixJ family two-component response regulator
MSSPFPDAIRVAIIDDDEIQCRSLARLVRAAGFHPLTFPSAEDFIAAPGRAAFGCLLLDIQLRGISGIALHQRLLAQGDRTPVIHITGHDDPAALAAAMNTGGAGFLRKTDSSTAIIEALRRVSSAP